MPKAYYFYLSIGLVLMTVSWRYAFNSLALIILGVTFLLFWSSCQWKFRSNLLTKFDYILIAFGTWQLFSIFWTEDLDAALKGAGLKFMFVLAPLTFSQVPPPGKRELKLASLLMIVGLAITDLYCLILAALHFNIYLDPEIFIYHRLSEPLGLNAIYLSLINGIGLFLILITDTVGKAWQKLMIAGFILIMLFLLQSKMVLSSILLMAGFFFIRKLWVSGKNRLLYILAATLILIFGIVMGSYSSRFSEFRKSEICNPLVEDDLSGMKVDGISIRIFQYRAFYEIMRDNPVRILFGYGLKGQQKALDRKYEEYKLYEGDEQDSTLAGLNFHNQYLNTWLTSGVIGFVLLILVLWQMAGTQGTKQTRIFLQAITFFFGLTFFSEMILERHRGGVVFLMVVLLYKNNSRNL